MAAHSPRSTQSGKGDGDDGDGDGDDDGVTRLAFQIDFIDKMVTQLLVTPQSNILSGVSYHITDLHMHFPSLNSSTYATIKRKQTTNYM